LARMNLHRLEAIHPRELTNDQDITRKRKLASVGSVHEQYILDTKFGTTRQVTLVPLSWLIVMRVALEMGPL
jgi:hypothetical protein